MPPLKSMAGLVLSLALVLQAPSLAAAQSAHDNRFYQDTYPFPQVNVPFSSRDIGISGPARTCVKLCDRDTSPCDPPVYKQADGRCSYFD